MSPLAARSAKYSSVRNVDTLSAAATLISWFTATPAAFAICRHFLRQRRLKAQDKLAFLHRTTPPYPADIGRAQEAATRLWESVKASRRAAPRHHISSAYRSASRC